MPPDLHITGYEKREGYGVCITNHRWLIDERIDESVQAGAFDTCPALEDDTGLPVKLT